MRIFIARPLIYFGLFHTFWTIEIWEWTKCASGYLDPIPFISKIGGGRFTHKISHRANNIFQSIFSCF